MPDTVLTTHAEVGHAELANAIRFLSMDAVEKAQSGHPGLPMGCADVATVLFTRFLKFDPTDPSWADRDRFVLSAGHGSMLLYSLLYLTGYADMPLDELKRFRQLGSRTAGHPEYGHAGGIETTTGPLGQGLANAVGMALAERLMAARFGSALVDHMTYVLASDGDLMEGISQEAIGLAGHHRLNKLVVLYDDNGISIDGPTSLAFTEDSLGRFAASGWAVTRVDGHDPEAVAAGIEAARDADRPSLIACRTVIGFGAAKKAGTAAAHGSPLGAEEIAAARAKLGWSHAPFEVPAPILAAWRAAGARGAATRVAWEGRLAAHADGAEFRRRMAGELPSGWAEAAAALKRQLAAEKPKLATRQSSGRALETLTQAIPELIGGSADLTGSVNTKTKETKPVTSADPAGRYIHWGVREHGMAAAMNGMALHGGVIPYSGTFLAFSDYSRPAIRLAGLMGIRVIHVLTHDSIGLGEDGPTHQPVEHLAALRAIPNLHVFRPADAMEATECWELALARRGGPSGLVLTRQALPALRQDDGAENLSARGAYVLVRPSTERKVTLLATGSEVQLAVEAQKLLAKEGIAAAVVSMPCWELFETQDSAYREEVLRPDTIRVAVEAAGAFGWTRYVASEADVVGMPGFGASGPAEALYQHFGITADAVVARVRTRLGRG